MPPLKLLHPSQQGLGVTRVPHRTVLLAVMSVPALKTSVAAIIPKSVLTLAPSPVEHCEYHARVH